MSMAGNNGRAAEHWGQSWPPGKDKRNASCHLSGASAEKACTLQGLFTSICFKKLTPATPRLVEVMQELWALGRDLTHTGDSGK